jgi:hypothetical protein
MSSRKQLLASAEISANGSRDQSRRELAGNRYRDLHGFALKPGFDRPQRGVRFAEADGDAFERAGDAASGFDAGVGLRFRIAAAVCGGLGLGELNRMLGERDRPSRSLPAAKSTSNKNFFAGALINKSALLRRGSLR